jgi:hypothetical protein
LRKGLKREQIAKSNQKKDRYFFQAVIQSKSLQKICTKKVKICQESIIFADNFTNNEISYGL